MASRLILASSSSTRRDMLRRAGLIFDVSPPRIDEAALRASLGMEHATPRDIADALAETKARKVSGKSDDALVIGCDQVLDFEGCVIGKPESVEALRAQLAAMRGKTHQLLSAVVIYKDGAPVWRHVGTVRMTMHQISDAYLAAYVARNWESARHSAGGYRLEDEGVRLFSQVSGDYFTVLGLPLVPLLSYLRQRGVIEQ